MLLYFVSILLACMIIHKELDIETAIIFWCIFDTMAYAEWWSCVCGREETCMSCLIPYSVMTADYHWFGEWSVSHSTRAALPILSDILFYYTYLAFPGNKIVFIFFFSCFRAAPRPTGETLAYIRNWIQEKCIFWCTRSLQMYYFRGL